MITNDTKFRGEISVFETNRSTKDYKIVILHGKGNKSLEPVYLARIVTLGNVFIYQEQNYYSRFSEAVESLWQTMFDFQDALDNIQIKC